MAKRLSNAKPVNNRLYAPTRDEINSLVNANIEWSVDGMTPTIVNKPINKLNTHIIDKGDNLYSILRRNGIEPNAKNINAVAKYNDIKNPNVIKEGMSIVLPPSDNRQPQTTYSASQQNRNTTTINTTSRYSNSAKNVNNRTKVQSRNNTSYRNNNKAQKTNYNNTSKNTNSNERSVTLDTVYVSPKNTKVTSNATGRTTNRSLSETKPVVNNRYSMYNYKPIDYQPVVSPTRTNSTKSTPQTSSSGFSASKLRHGKNRRGFTVYTKR